MKIITVKSCFTCPFADTTTLCGMALYCKELDMQVTDSIDEYYSELPDGYIHPSCKLKDCCENNLHNT